MAYYLKLSSMALSGCKPKLFCNTARIASALCSVKSTKYIRSNAASLNAADKKRRKCTLIPEDGVGPELVHSVLEVYKGVIDSFETVTAKKSFAFDYAIKNNRKKVTAVHKAFIMSHRFYSNSANEPDESSEPKIQVDGVVKEKLESARKLYVNDMSYQAGFAQAEAVLLPELEARDKKLLTKSEELRKLKAPAAARSRMEFYERENELTMYNLKEEEMREMAKISDLKEKKIKQVYFKWRFLLSPDNPKFNLDINQQLLRRISEENIDLEVFLRAVGNVFEYTASRWYELFDMNGEPVQILKVKSYDEAVACLFEKTTKK